MSCKWLRIVHVSAAAVAFNVLAQSALAQTSYTGANNGDWATAGNWSAGVPNGGVNATINNGNTVVVGAGQTQNAANLTVGAGVNSGVLVSNGAWLQISGATVTNNGLIRLLSTGGDTRLRTQGVAKTFSGTGTLFTDGGSIEGGGTLTNAAGHTMRGFGSWGFNNTAFANAGTWAADVAAQGITFDPAAVNNTNTGLIRAANGGTFSMNGNGGGGLDNTGGTIRAENASFVDVTNSFRLSGGTVTTTGTGIVRAAAGNSSFMSNFTNSGNLRIGNGAWLHMNGTVTNNATITSDSAGGDTRIRTEGIDLTFAGTGVIDTTAGLNIEGGGRVTFGANQTVRGKGDFGFNNTIFTNNGIVDSNVTGGTLTLDPAAVTNAFVNTNILRATSGGTLQFTGNGGGDFVNTGGTINASGTNSVVLLVNSARIIGGTLSNNAGGKIGSGVNQTVYLQNITIPTGSIYTGGNNAYNVLEGGMTLNGVLTWDAAPTGDIRLRTNGSDVSLTGTGQIIGVHQPTVAITRIDGGGRVTIGSGITLRGQAFVGENNTIFTNNGTIDSDVSGGLMSIDPAAVANALINNSTMRSSNGATLYLTGNGGGDFVNNGTITSTGANSQTLLTNSARVVGGTLSNSSGGLIGSDNGQFVYLQNPTIPLGSTFVGGNNTYNVVESGLTINGTFTWNAAPTGDPRLRSNGADITLGGSGQIVMTHQVGVAIAKIDGGGRVTIGPNITIRGSGQIGENNTVFTNNGLIDADLDSVRGISIDPAAVTNAFVNNATLRSSNGATLVLTGSGGGDFINNGTITSMGTGSKTLLTASARVVGGTFSSTTGATIGSADGQTVYLQNVTIPTGSTYIGGNNTYNVVEGGLTLNGTLNWGDPTTPVDNRLRTNGSNVTISGTGQIVMVHRAGVHITRIDGGASLTFGNGITVRGSGLIGENNTVLVNNGLIHADLDSVRGITIDPAGVGNAFTNTGTLRASNGATLSLTGSGGGTFRGNGVVNPVGLGVIEATSSADVDFGTTVSGTGTVSVINSSTFVADTFRVGTLNTNTSGTARFRAGLTPGLAAGTGKIGTIAVAGLAKVDLTNNGVVITGMTQSAVRNLIAPARNAGQWNGSGIGSSLANNNGKAIGYTLASDVFTAPGTFLGQSFLLTDVLARYTFNGDANLDGSVTFDDLLRVAQNYDTVVTGKTWSQGDFTYDGLVNFDDLLALAQQYSKTLLTSGESDSLTNVAGVGFVSEWLAARSLVPEPTSLGVLALAGGLLRRRR